MKNVTYIEFQDFLGEHGFHVSSLERGTRSLATSALVPSTG